MNNSPLYKPALEIAIRFFFSNVDNDEELAYQCLQDCERPHETFIDDYLQDKPFYIWQPFNGNSVGYVQDLIDDLMNDIIFTMENHNKK